MASETEDARREREREFHDQWASTLDPATIPVTETFTGSTTPTARWLSDTLGDVRGLRLLDLGTGFGEGAVWFASRGADVVALDISPEMLRVVERVAAHHGVTVETREGSADDLSQFPDESFDIVYGANVLHHVDMRRALLEVRRLLKPGGRAGFCDPLAYNPAIKVYRRMAEDVRSEDEAPLTRASVRIYDELFTSVERRFFWLTTLLVFVKFFLIDRVHPSADRYWRRIITEEPRLRPWYVPLERLDRALLRLAPPLGWLCWEIGVVVRKG